MASFFLKLIKFDDTFLTVFWGNNTHGISRAKTVGNLQILEEKNNHYKTVLFAQGRFDSSEHIIANKMDIFLHACALWRYCL